MTLALRAYVALSHLLAPVWHLGLKHRLRRGKETPRSVHQKLGHEYADRPAGPMVWGHAVGVGEAMALAGLFARMAQARPDVHFLITTTARTSGDALRRTGLPPQVQHQFAPADTPGAVRRFLNHWQPDLAIWCEMDLWPTLIDATAARGIPRVLVNARLNDTSMARRRKGRWIYRALLPGFDRLFAQNDSSAAHLVALGADPSQVTVSGTIKSLTPPLACDADDLSAWLAALRTRPVWLLASSHPGEETMALQAHQQLLERHPDALLVIAPRAPARGGEVAALCQPPAPLRSTGTHLPDDGAVYVADTIGEMGLWYRLAPVALVGGSFAAVGGHNPHEPLALGCRVLHGPNTWNFAESYEQMDAAGLSLPVADAAAVEEAVEAAWAGAALPDARPPEDGRAAGVLQHLLDLLPR
ncbi:3-deoxy-D-manno-octulosonic acid transferase [uncultured Hydrogenophaga sp.]|uniref:3-deoxy-D-manno-octulosonic acid transferase n=1 Tax=uncultured Hydrogenophaga sp. TaxID=199683 RepID=UPI00265EC8E9|nr:3-deoxy-D-manno-octulosonic acid transferase [uncultured Hydrogenophaga sp.]